MSFYPTTYTLCGNSACPLEAFHGAGPYRMDPTDDAQANLPTPPREVLEALASIEKHPSESDIHHNFWHVTLLERFEEIHGGWTTVSGAKKQPARRKGKGKKVYNWQAARQNGPKPLIIGKGKPVQVKTPAKPVGEAAKGAPEGSTVSTPATSVAEDALSTRSEKTDWAEDA
ncbi:MAG: hypothetical protein Q9208_006313 [Pyrenodesmia sp. 3 TL-2023]